MNKTIAYSHYCLNNFISCVSLVLYCFSLLSATRQVQIEYILTIWKTIIEIMTNEFNVDLFCHHMIFFIAAFYVLTVEFWKRYQFILVNVHFVHFAILFRNLRRLMRQIFNKNFQFLQYCYLYLWLPTSFYRNYIILSTLFTISSLNERLLFFTGSISLCFLDIYWTPWKYYLRMCL